MSQSRGRLGARALWCWQVNAAHAPLAFHALNLGLHVVATALVGLVVWSLTGHAGAALLAAAFFGVNAVQVESVAYLTGRSELLAAVGVLGACLAALSRRWWLMVGSMALGLSGKESAAVGVMLVPICLWYQDGRRRWCVATLLGGLGLSAAIVSLTYRWWLENHLAVGTWALLQTTAIVRVALLSVLPVGQTIDYDYAQVPVALQVYASVCLLAGLWWAWRHRTNRLLVCGVAWTVCAVAPRLIVPTPLSVFTEHQFYLPLVGVAILLASVLTQESYDGYRPAL